MLKFKTKKSDEVKTSPLTKKSNAVAKATMFFATLIATMFCFAVTAFADDDPLTVVNNLSTFIFKQGFKLRKILKYYGYENVS